MTVDDMSVTRGEHWYQALLDTDSRPVPESLRSTSVGPLDGVDIAPSVFFDPEFHRLEMTHMWNRVWQMACREEQIAEPGDTYVYEIGDASLIVVRGDDGTIRALHNSCLHRGTMLRTRPGKVDCIRCPYHGLTWNTDGSLREIPSAWDFPHVEYGDLQLPEARVDTWGGFVFVNLDPDAAPLADFLEDLPWHFESFPLEERWTSLHVVRGLPCNWKVAMEAFIESYHVMAVHPQLLTTANDALTQYDVYGDHVSRMMTAVGVASEHLDPAPDDTTIVSEMLGRRSSDPVDPIEPGTARTVLAERVRASLEKRTGLDLSQLTDAELLDGIEYFLFPNLMVWAGYLTPFVYRFRPEGNDPDRCIVDIMKLDPLPQSGERPAPAPTRFLEPGETWADVPELGPFGRVFNQDGATVGRVQRGLHASVASRLTLSQYQESRIRHFHATLDAYLANDGLARD